MIGSTKRWMDSSLPHFDVERSLTLIADCHWLRANHFYDITDCLRYSANFLEWHLLSRDSHRDRLWISQHIAWYIVEWTSLLSSTELYQWCLAERARESVASEDAFHVPFTGPSISSHLILPLTPVWLSMSLTWLWSEWPSSAIPRRQSNVPIVCHFFAILLIRCSRCIRCCPLQLCWLSITV